MIEDLPQPLCASPPTPAAEITRHPSAALYEVVFNTALPSVSSLAKYKNVSLRSDEHEPLLRHALQHISRNTMRKLMKGNSEAALSVQLAICHSLDVYAAAKMIGTLEAIQGIPSDAATLVAQAEEAMKPAFANDTNPTIRIWPDLAAIAGEYYRRERAAPEPAFAAVQGTATRVSIISPNRLWADVIRAATAAQENPVHG